MWRVSSRAPSEGPALVGRALPHTVQVRQVESHADYAACEEISRYVWGVAERNIVPRELLLTMQLNGGLVHGAFLADGRLVGFCFGFAGVRDGRLRLCSHQLGVLTDFRGAGIGVALKQAQRRDALRLGYELISWTFDPLEARNAYLNLRRLGCIARIYDPNHYGEMEDELNQGLPSDRLEAEWWIRGEKRAAGDQRPLAILSIGTRGEPQPGPDRLDPARLALIRVPADFQSLKRRDPTLALEWRMQSRAAFEAALAAGLVAVDFLREGAYLLQPGEPLA
jgi:predicted GNAT superfamily acetyltransferase